MDEQNFQTPVTSTQPTPSGILGITMKGFLLETIETVVIALAIFVFIYTLIAQPHLVKGQSMEPNFHEGEYILTSKVYNWWGTPQRGDVIVLKSPDDKSIQFIKRIIGLPGEKIKIANDHVIIYNKQYPNGQTLHESYLSSNIVTEGSTWLPNGELYTIPQNKYVVMGDNRTQSYDSRSWGLLDKNDIIGKAFFVYWPIKDFGFVAHASYSH